MINVRLATLADGRSYIISHIDFNTDRVYCFGELRSYRGQRKNGTVIFTSVVHDREPKAPFKVFDLRDVKRTEVARDEALMKRLMDQARRAQRGGPTAAAPAIPMPEMSPAERALWTRALGAALS